FIVMRRTPPTSTIFPYTTLFRSTKEGKERPMSNATEQARETAVHTRELLEEVWEAIDQGGEYEDTDALDYLDEMPLEIIWEVGRSEEHTSELQSRENLVCRLLLE